MKATRYELHPRLGGRGHRQGRRAPRRAKRRFYFDEDSWALMGAEDYDAQGKLWKVRESFLIPVAETGACDNPAFVQYDLVSGRALRPGGHGCRQGHGLGGREPTIREVQRTPSTPRTTCARSATAELAPLFLPDHHPGACAGPSCGPGGASLPERTIMTTHLKKLVLGLAMAGICAPAAYAFQFEAGSVRGSLDSTLTAGFGKRVEGRECSHHGDQSTPCGADANTAVWGNGDDGNLNYDKGDLFTTHLKGCNELLLSFPDEWKFMGRVGWLPRRPTFVADDTAHKPARRRRKQAVGQYVRLADLWVSKGIRPSASAASSPRALTAATRW